MLVRYIGQEACIKREVQEINMEGSTSFRNPKSDARRLF